MTVGHALPHLLQVRHSHRQQRLGRCCGIPAMQWTMHGLAQRTCRGSSRIGVANCLEECCFCGVVVALEPFCLFFLVGLGD